MSLAEAVRSEPDGTDWMDVKYMFHNTARTYHNVWKSLLDTERRSWEMTAMPEGKEVKRERLLFVTRVCPKQGISLLHTAVTKFDKVYVVWLVTEDEWRTDPDRFCLGRTVYRTCPRYTLVLSRQDELYAICNCIPAVGAPPCPVTRAPRCINQDTIENLIKPMSGLFNEHPEISRQQKARRRAAAAERMQREATAAEQAPRKRARKAGD